MKKTQRGFTIYSQFTDTYKNKITIVNSSSILKRCWIYIDGKGDKNPEGIKDNSAAMHISSGQAKLIIKALQKFIDNEGY